MIQAVFYIHGINLTGSNLKLFLKEWCSGKILFYISYSEMI